MCGDKRNHDEEMGLDVFCLQQNGMFCNICGYYLEVAQKILSKKHSAYVLTPGEGKDWWFLHRHEKSLFHLFCRELLLKEKKAAKKKLKSSFDPFKASSSRKTANSSCRTFNSLPHIDYFDIENELSFMCTFTIVKHFMAFLNFKVIMCLINESINTVMKAYNLPQYPPFSRLSPSCFLERLKILKFHEQDSLLQDMQKHLC
jgi:hypothetical protein